MSDSILGYKIEYKNDVEFRCALHEPDDGIDDLDDYDYDLTDVEDDLPKDDYQGGPFEDPIDDMTFPLDAEDAETYPDAVCEICGARLFPSSKFDA